MSDDFHGCSSHRAPVPVSKHYFMAIIWSSPFNKSHLMVRLTVELTGHMTSDSIAGTPCVTSPGSSRRVLRQVIVWQELVTLQTSAPGAKFSPIAARLAWRYVWTSVMLGQHVHCPNNSDPVVSRDSDENLWKSGSGKLTWQRLLLKKVLVKGERKEILFPLYS